MAARTSAVAATAERELIITRIFDAPRSLVFEAWAKREHLVHWSAPRGFTITYCEGDLRPGGAWRCCMRSREGSDHWLGGVYREIVEPHRLVFTHAWEDENGKPGRETLVTLTFGEHDGKTKLTFHQAVFESAAERDSHREGWGECLDKLEEYLGERS
jgi:uncharacterized protein YndB with AHSA1/START domain